MMSVMFIIRPNGFHQLGRTAVSAFFPHTRWVSCTTRTVRRTNSTAKYFQLISSFVCRFSLRIGSKHFFFGYPFFRWCDYRNDRWYFHNLQSTPFYIVRNYFHVVVFSPLSVGKICTKVCSMFFETKLPTIFPNKLWNQGRRRRGELRASIVNEKVQMHLMY